MSDNERNCIDWEVVKAGMSPIDISDAYYERAMGALSMGSWLDALIDLQISEAHLIGPYAPRHNPVDAEKFPLRRTLPHLAKLQRETRAKLRSIGPGPARRYGQPVRLDSKPDVS